LNSLVSIVNSVETVSDIGGGLRFTVQVQFELAGYGMVTRQLTGYRY
jgi:hypothetical protein